MRSCSAACPVDSSHAQLLTGDAMSLHPRKKQRQEPKSKNQDPRTKFQADLRLGSWSLVLGIWFLGWGLAHAGEPRRSSVVEAVERARGAVVNIHSERTVMGP